MHIPEYNPTCKLHLRTLHRKACTGRFTWYMSCTFQTWNSTKNNSFHQEFDSLITYLRWLNQLTYLTPQWHQVIFMEFSFEEFCHLQIWSAKSKTMLCNQQTQRQEMFPDKSFSLPHCFSVIPSSVVFVNKLSTSSKPQSLSTQSSFHSSETFQQILASQLCTYTGWHILAELKCGSLGWNFSKYVQWDTSTLNFDSIYGINLHNSFVVSGAAQLKLITL